MADEFHLSKNSHGSYILVINMRHPCRIKAGQLPEREYPPGIYFYIGRAKRYLRGRLARHLRREKKLFWHIDTLLRKSEIKEIWCRLGFFDECALTSAIIRHFREFCSPIPGFGASDCHCPSHLIHCKGADQFLSSIRHKIKCKEVSIDDIKNIPI
jgi:sugar fermentation stimulation protein A